MSNKHRVILGLIVSSNKNSFQIHLNGCSLQGVHGATYPASPHSPTSPHSPPSLFDLAHLSTAVPGSLLELPPRWLCPLDGEGGGGMAEMEGALWGVVGGVWDDRAGRPTPQRFLKSWVSKHGGSGQRVQAEETWRRPTIYWPDWWTAVHRVRKKKRRARALSSWKEKVEITLFLESTKLLFISSCTHT